MESNKVNASSLDAIESKRGTKAHERGGSSGSKREIVGKGFLQNNIVLTVL